MSLTIEISGALFAIVYLLLAARRRWLAWLPYIASSILYFPVFWQSELVFNALLQLVFVWMGVRGLLCWRQQKGNFQPVLWGLKRHGVLIAVWAVVTLALGGVASLSTPGWVAFADAGVAVGSIIATCVTVERVMANWWYWLAIDSLAMVVFSAQGLWVSAGLYAVYCLLCIHGLREWRRAVIQG